MKLITTQSEPNQTVSPRGALGNRTSVTAPNILSVHLTVGKRKGERGERDWGPVSLSTLGRQNAKKNNDCPATETQQ